MAISNNDAILNILKCWYKDGVANLLIRASSALKEIPMTKVEGKVQNFAALYSRGGAVSGDFLVAEEKASKNVKNAEFSVTPGALFSVYSYNAKEVQASLSKKGAYMKVAGNKLMAATVAFRQTLAAALYGKGYGEVGILANGGNFTQNTDTTITLPEDAIAKIDVGSTLVVKPSVTSATEGTKLEVLEISGNEVKVKPDTTYVAAAKSAVCLAGSMDGSGRPLLPQGLDAWLPIVNGRTGQAWTTYIGTVFNGVNRSVAPDRLAGAFYQAATQNETKSKTIQSLMRKLRRAGSNANLVIMNDEDFLELAEELEANNKIYSQPTKAKKDANLGFSQVSASFSTNFIENIIDDPFCPKGKFYILDKDAVEYFVYTNAEKVISDGISDNNPGKQDAEALESQGDKDGNALLIDDLLTVQDGKATSDGPAVEVTLNFFGSLAVTNPSVCGVGLFAQASYDSVLGYAE